RSCLMPGKKENREAGSRGGFSWKGRSPAAPCHRRSDAFARRSESRLLQIPSARLPASLFIPSESGDSVLRLVWLVLWKDLVVEWRKREIISTMLFFAVMVVLIFSFAFLAEGRASGDATSGILWTATAFAGTLGLGRAADRERD